ncbi:unnamed protein product [Gulo gulo]|uniref:Uncharacterized protein n=1 Tax=Gulo gulo TaxID=48420 RepID=A0A9X9Q707_GULGU|nr:unnamed protein product [Gulo gulo]
MEMSVLSSNQHLWINPRKGQVEGMQGRSCEGQKAQILRSLSWKVGPHARAHTDSSAPASTGAAPSWEATLSQELRSGFLCLLRPSHRKRENPKGEPTWEASKTVGGASPRNPSFGESLFVSSL